MSNQIQNLNVKVDEPMNGSSYEQCATPRYLKTVQFSSVNLESLAQTWLSSPIA